MADAAVDSEAGEWASDAGDSAVPDAAVPDPGLVLDDCDGEAVGTLNWPWSRWPARELLQLEPDGVEAAPCRIRFDRDSDGVVDRSWGYYYSAGVLQEVRSAWHGVVTGETLYDETGRPWASCSGDCELYLYDDETHQFRVAIYTNPPELPRALIRAEHDSEGRPTRWSRCVYTPCSEFGADHVNPESDICTETRITYAQGIIQSSWSMNPLETYSTTFHPDGTPHEYTYQNDPDQVEYSCDARGWELSNMFAALGDPNNADEKWETRYTLGSDDRVATSRTVVAFPSAGAFTTRWTWAADGRSVQLDSMDEAGLWQESHVESQEPWFAQEHDALGNLTSIRYDDDRDGVYERTDSYAYEGTGPCREGEAVDLAPSSKDSSVTRCEHSPLNRTIIDTLWAMQ